MFFFFIFLWYNYVVCIGVFVLGVGGYMRVLGRYK